MRDYNQFLILFKTVTCVYVNPFKPNELSYLYQ